MTASLGLRMAARARHRVTMLARSTPAVTGAVRAALRSTAATSGTGGGICSSSAAATLKFPVQRGVAELGHANGPLAIYEALVEEGKLRDDPGQRQILQYLTAVFHGAPKRTARGLYLYGTEGCGKTMSMDLFFSAIKGVPGVRVVRKHFHDFLHDVQVKLHSLKCEGRSTRGRPIELVGECIAQESDVLCFDEFAVTTIQDCVLLMPLFSVLFQHGVTIVATSNRAPDDLYSDGLNRHIYMPSFLEVLRRHCKIHHLQSTTDYRVVHNENSADAGVFCWPQDRSFIDQWFEVATGGQGGSLCTCVDISYGRSLRVPQLSSCGRVARFSFEDLCRRHLSAEDYLQLCRHFHTILVDDVPPLSVDENNELARFTSFIDSCYEHNIRLICSMAGPPKALLGSLTQLQHMSVSSLGPAAGCGDGDTSTSSCGVLEAIDRIKVSMAERQAAGLGREASRVAPPRALLEGEPAVEVLASGGVARVQAHGDADIDIWRQAGSDGDSRPAPPQVSKAWDDRRRISSFTWESVDPTSEQQSIRGVFTQAVASLKEKGFAVERAISRLQEMQTETFQQNHRLKHLVA